MGKIAQIERIAELFYEDDDFRKITKHIKNRGFHLFSAICRDKDERTLARSIRYFLDPSESHGLGPKLLRNFLHELVVLKREKCADSEHCKLHIDSLPLERCLVRREVSLGEFGRADVVIDLPEKLYCLVELKLYSSEGLEQTNRYNEFLQSRVERNHGIVLRCFLTPDGHPAQSDNFTPMSFEVLKKIFGNAKVLSQVNNDNHFLLDHLVRWIKELCPMEDNLKQICRSVYAKFQKEIDLIMQHAPTPTAFLKEVSSKINELYSNDYYAHSGNNWLTVSPTCWLEDEMLQNTKSYSKVYIGLNYDEEDLLHCDIIVPNKKCRDYIYEQCTGVKDSHPWWRLRIATYESFDPKNLATDWDKRVNKISKKTKEHCDTMFRNVDAEEIKNLL
ncbi:MAG: hypothetical protein F4Y39_00615 [Gemmatimonadetes bacterium]|nr:hypothetical protein [Gemmatimonadota bacterium]MYF73402.1 hypothetical protein [Gemmatimonadota bacterium]